MEKRPKNVSTDDSDKPSVSEKTTIGPMPPPSDVAAPGTDFRAAPTLVVKLPDKPPPRPDFAPLQKKAPAPRAAPPGVRGPPHPFEDGDGDDGDLESSTIARPRYQDEPRSHGSQVLVFFSCKGGSGATAISTNAAHHFARTGRSTCLVDLDLQLGDALAATGLQSRRTIGQVLSSTKQGLGFEPQLLPKHASGLRVLSQAGSLDDLDQITSEGLVTLVDGLRASFDVIVVDGVRDFSDNVLAILDVADRIVVLAVQDVLAIRRARWALSILRKIGFDPKDIVLVVNHFRLSSDVSFATLERVFTPTPVMALSEDRALVKQALDRAIPLADLNPNHMLPRTIGRLCARLMGDSTVELNDAEVTSKRRGAFAKFMFWRKD